MKRYGGLWGQLVSFPHLWAAYRKARRGKRKHPGVAAFELNVERELCSLQDELIEQTYAPGPYRTFTIVDPKPRLISAAPFRDRVVHHALTSILEPIWERLFIADTYACRKGKGSHAAVDRFQKFAQQNQYVLKCDVSKYFPSIDHELLKGLLADRIKDRHVLWLAYRIIDHSNPQEPVQQWYPGDDLFTPSERRRGLPLGNQTSQFFANVYLNPFDHWAKRTLKARSYIRYVDDFVILGSDTGWLSEARHRCREELARWRLTMHPSKAVISRTEDGTRFLGYRVFPTHRLLPRSNVVRMQRRWRAMLAARRVGRITLIDLRCRLAAWLGHARQANSFRLLTWLFRDRVKPHEPRGRSKSRAMAVPPCPARRVVEQQRQELPLREPQQQQARQPEQQQRISSRCHAGSTPRRRDWPIHGSVEGAFRSPGHRPGRLRLRVGLAK